MPGWRDSVPGDIFDLIAGGSAGHWRRIAHNEITIEI